MDMRVSARLRRAWHHWMSPRDAGPHAYPPATLAAITEAITAGERTHRGEVRLIVEASLPFDIVWAGLSCRQRALALFSEHAVWDTEENCGVLIYINLAERKVDIVADRGINGHIAPGDWRAVCTDMTHGFARGRFHDSTLEAIERVNAMLRAHFPANGPRANELPDQPILM